MDKKVSQRKGKKGIFGNKRMSVDSTGGDVVKELLGQLYTCATSTECLKISGDLAGSLKALGVTSLEAFGVLESLGSGLKDKKSGLVREGALLGIWGLAKGMGRMAEPYLLDLLPAVFEALADKGQAVREAAQLSLAAIVDLFSEHSAKMILPVLYDAMSKKWQIKIGALEQLEVLVNKSPIYIAFALPTVIKHVEECLHDTKPEVGQLL